MIKSLRIKNPTYRVVAETQNGFTVYGSSQDRRSMERMATRIVAETPGARVFVEQASRSK